MSPLDIINVWCVEISLHEGFGTSVIIATKRTTLAIRFNELAAMHTT